jgi:hypothetical protein
MLLMDNSSGDSTQDADMRVVPVDDLKFQKRTEELPADLIDRITLIHHAFRDYLSVTLEETIDNFKYDAQPENEIRVWEHMAKTVLTLRYELGWPPEKVAAAVKVVLGLSMGAVQDNTLDQASTEQVVAAWNKRDPQ